MKSKYFKLTELVCPHIFNKFGDFAWTFVDPKLIETIDFIKEHLYPNEPMIINNWGIKGTYTQRGFRCNLCNLVKEKTAKNTVYVSAHTTGKAVDFTIQGKSPDSIRREINAIAPLLPHNIRLESDSTAPTWVHIDVYDGGSKITYFNG